MNRRATLRWWHCLMEDEDSVYAAGIPGQTNTNVCDLAASRQRGI